MDPAEDLLRDERALPAGGERALPLLGQANDGMGKAGAACGPVVRARSVEPGFGAAYGPIVMRHFGLGGTTTVLIGCTLAPAGYA